MTNHSPAKRTLAPNHNHNPPAPICVYSLRSQWKIVHGNCERSPSSLCFSSLSRHLSCSRRHGSITSALIVLGAFMSSLSIVGNNNLGKWSEVWWSETKGSSQHSCRHQSSSSSSSSRRLQTTEEEKDADNDHDALTYQPTDFENDENATVHAESYRRYATVHFVQRRWQEANRPIDDFSHGKSCTRNWDQANNRFSPWDCQECFGEGNCTKLKPRQQCEPNEAKQEDLDIPWPRSSTHARPSSSSLLEPRSRILRAMKQETTVEMADCSVTNPMCFNIEKCPSFEKDETEPLPVYVYPDDPEMISDDEKGNILPMVKELQIERPDLVRRVENAHDACLLLVGHRAFKSQEELHVSSTWNHGQNHLIWLANNVWWGKGDFAVADNDFGLAALTSTSITQAHLRRDYDVFLPLWQQWNRPRRLDDLDIHRPRNFLLTFKGGVMPWPPVYYQHRWIAGEYWSDSSDILADLECLGKDYTFESFSDTLLNSTFVFCPGGNGVSSYRMAEALMADAIPVITANHGFPYAPEIGPLQSHCAVTVSEARIVDLPHILASMPLEEVKNRRVACRQLLYEYFGKVLNEKQNVWTKDIFRRAFATTMKIWKHRVHMAQVERRAHEELHRRLF